MPVTFSALWDNHPSNLDADNELNFWGTGMQGDHVDVWNGSKQASYISHPDPLAGDDYFERAQEVWFWEIA